MTKIADLHNDVAAIDASDDYRVLSRVDHRDLERRETCDLRYRLGVVVDVKRPASMPLETGSSNLLCACSGPLPTV